MFTYFRVPREESQLEKRYEPNMPAMQRSDHRKSTGDSSKDGTHE